MVRAPRPRPSSAPAAFPAAVRAMPHGKKLPDAVYVHRSLFPRLPAVVREGIVSAGRLAHVDPLEYELFKLGLGAPRVSFLQYPGFEREAFPALAQSVTVDLVTGAVRRASYAAGDGTPLLHRKEAVLDPRDGRVPALKAVTEALVARGAFRHPERIGHRGAWEQALRAAHVRVEGSRVVAMRLPRAKANGAAWLDGFDQNLGRACDTSAESASVARRPTERSPVARSRPARAQLAFDLAPRFPDHAVRMDLPTGPLAPGLVALPARIHRRWPIVVSYGVGVDSTAVLVLMRRSGIRPDLILFANTGSERPETLAYIAVMNDYLARVGFPLITVVQYTPVEAEYDNLYDNSTQFAMLPSLAYGGHKHGCSLKFKVGPMDGVVKRWGPAIESWAMGGKVVRIIGYDDSPADNERRGRFEDRGGAEETDDYSYWYPLQDVHWDRARCIAEIEREGLPVPPKSSCYFCPSTKPHELIELVLEHPDLAWKIIEMEQRAAPRLDVIDGLWGAGVVGEDDGIPKPGSMSEFIVQWMVDGRAYGRMPRMGDKGVVASEVSRMPNIGRVFRLPMHGEPSRDAVAQLATRGRAMALQLRAHFERVYGPVEVMIEAGRRRSELRKAKARERDRAERAALKAGLPWPPPKEKKPAKRRRKKGELPYPGWTPHVPRPLPSR